jgi:hypothetical protein
MSALVLVLVIASSSEYDPSLGAIAQGARDALVPDARIVVEPRTAAPSDEGAIDLGSSAHATAVVEVMWADGLGRKVRVRVHVVGEPIWREREISFRTDDDAGERGRTIGLALGTMIGESGRPLEPPSVPPEGAPPPPAPTADTPPPPVAPRRIPDRPEAVRRFGARVAATTAVASSGSGPMFGVAFDVGWWLSTSLRLHAVGGGRLGTLATAGDARVTTLAMGGGITWQPFIWRSFAVGPRVDLLALYDGVRLRESSGTQTEMRWVPGADVMIDGAWRLAPWLTVVVDVGAEGALGTARVFVGEERVATIAPVRFIAQLGAGIRF